MTWKAPRALPYILAGSPLDPRLTFSNFFAGECNQLAFVEAQRCALGLRPVYNPLFIYAAPGLGKTHLLHAIAHSAAEVGRRTLYLTAERALYDFLPRIKKDIAPAFLDALHGFYVLAVDDFQYLDGVRAAAGALVNLFLESGRQLVIAADRPPRDLDFDERVKSRLAGGLSIEIGGLDGWLRARIIEARIATARESHPCFAVSDKVIGHIASTTTTNGRDLDAAVNRLLARFLMSGEVSMEITDVAIGDLVQTAPKKVTIEDVQSLVSRHFHVSRVDILSARRAANVVLPRHIAMYLSKVLTIRSLPEIGRRFGQRDHTTVLHAVRKISALVAADSVVAAEVAQLTEMLLR